MSFSINSINVISNLNVQATSKVNFNDNYLEGVKDPVANDHAVNLKFLNDKLGSLLDQTGSVFENTVRLITDPASDTNLFTSGVAYETDKTLLTAIADGLLVIDGVTPEVDDNVVVSIQGDFTGVYDVKSIGGISEKFQLQRNKLVSQVGVPPYTTVNGVLVRIGDGKVFSGSSWKSIADTKWEQVSLPHPKVDAPITRTYDTAAKVTKLGFNQSFPWTSITINNDPTNLNMGSTTSQITKNSNFSNDSSGPLPIFSDFPVSVDPAKTFCVMVTARTLFTYVKEVDLDIKLANTGCMQYQFMLTTKTPLPQPLIISATHYSGNNTTVTPLTIAVTFAVDPDSSKWLLTLAATKEPSDTAWLAGDYTCRTNLTYDIIDTTVP